MFLCVLCKEFLPKVILLTNTMCGYKLYADVNVNLGGPAKVKCKSKSTEMYADKAGPPIVKLFNFWHFIHTVALFHSQLCAGFDMRHKKFCVNGKNMKSYSRPQL